MEEPRTFVLLMYALIGISGALSVIALIRGFVTYISRLGTERRKEGIDIMEWAVGFVITSLVLIGILKLYLSFTLT